MDRAQAFAILAIIIVVLMFVSAFKKHSPKTKAKIDALKKTQQEYEKQMRSNIIERIIWLKSNLKAGNITQHFFATEMGTVIKHIELVGMDIQIIELLPAYPVPSTKQLVTDRLNIANELNNANEITDKEYEQHINESLDIYNSLKK